jgi:hypothetical protein
MRRILFSATLILLSLTAMGQEKSRVGAKIRLVEIPRDWVLMTIASQSDSPLRIEEARFLLRVDKPDIVQGYKIKNVSSKPVALFTIVSWNITGSGGTLPIPSADGRHLLYPGETFDSINDSGRYEIVPFTEEIVEQLQRNQGWNLKKRMSDVYIMLIDRAVFSDGLIFKDEKTSAALRNRLQEAEP